MKRKPSTPDLRPSWRDPDMPVFRNYKMANGSIIESVSPAYESGFRQFLIDTDPGRLPSYRTDPTYNLRRRK